MIHGNDREMEPLPSSRPLVSTKLQSSASYPQETLPLTHTFDYSRRDVAESSTFWNGTKLVFLYIIAEIRRQPLSFILAIFTVFITVTVIALLTSAVSRASLIFFRMSEINAGRFLLLIFCPLYTSIYTHLCQCACMCDSHTLLHKHIQSHTVTHSHTHA